MGYLSLNANQAAAPERLRGIIFTNNDIVAPSTDTGIFIDGLQGGSIKGNTVFNGLNAIAAGNCTRTEISYNTLTGAARSGTLAEIRITSNCDRMIIEGNTSLDGDKWAMVQNDAANSVVRNNTTLRETGDYGVVMSSLASDGMVEGTIMAAAGQVVSSPDSASRNGSGIDLTNGGGANGSSIFWVNGDPTTTRASRPHKRGDIAFNEGSGPTKFWRCTVSGTPGTWVE